MNVVDEKRPKYFAALWTQLHVFPAQQRHGFTIQVDSFPFFDFPNSGELAIDGYISEQQLVLFSTFQGPQYIRFRLCLRFFYTSLWMGILSEWTSILTLEASAMWYNSEDSPSDISMQEWAFKVSPSLSLGAGEKILSLIEGVA